MKLPSSLVTGLILASVCAALPARAQSQNYPTKPIHVVFPYPAGSALDAVGRLISERASRILGQPMVFENRPGANGILGTSHVARAVPDGYTIHLTTTSAFILNSFLRKDLPYDPMKSFVPITAAADIPVALMVSSRIPVKNTSEFVAYLKANPGKLNFASVGNGSFNHLLMEQFKAAAGVNMVHIPYQGANAIPTELIAGRIDATVLSIGSVMGQWKAGNVKVLATMADKRSPTQPDVPAIKEEISAIRPFNNWMGFVAPAKTPDAIIKKLNEAFVAVLAQPDVRTKIEEQRWSVIGNTSEQFRALLKDDMAVVEAAFNSAGIKPE